MSRSILPIFCIFILICLFWGCSSQQEKFQTFLSEGETYLEKGEFEKDFLLFFHRQSEVEAFIKIVEFKHTFASIPYIRVDGLMAHYCPDFMVRTKACIYIVETKADKDITDANVRQKQKATLGFIAQLNGLNPDMRNNKEWKYLLLSDAKFYMLSKNGASFEDIAKVSELSKAVVSGNLFES